MRQLKLYFLSVALLFGISSCDDDDGGDVNTIPCAVDFDRKALLSNIGNNMIIPAYADLKGHTASLKTATDVFVASPNTSTLQSLRAEWLEAYFSWQRASFYAFGPAGRDMDEAEYLSEFMNTYPTDTADIETLIAKNEYDLPRSDVRGFPAMDYLINGIGNDDQELLSYYSQGSSYGVYLQALASQMHSKVQSVHQKWIGGSLNYLATFTGNDGRDAGSPITVMINGVISYYEVNIRDGKIGYPSGVRSHGKIYPRSVEAYYKNDISIQLANEAMVAYRDFYLGKAHDGTDGIGLHDYVQATGAKQFLTENPLHQSIAQTFDQVIIDINALQSPLSNTVSQSPEVVVETFNTMQSLTSLLKSEMAPALCVPITVVDNDGD